MNWTSFFVGLLAGAWMMYWVLSIVTDEIRGAKHVFSWGIIAVASSLLTRLMMGGGH